MRSLFFLRSVVEGKDIHQSSCFSFLCLQRQIMDGGAGAQMVGACQCSQSEWGDFKFKHKELSHGLNGIITFYGVSAELTLHITDKRSVKATASVHIAAFSNVTILPSVPLDLCSFNRSGVWNSLYSTLGPRQFINPTVPKLHQSHCNIDMWFWGEGGVYVNCRGQRTTLTSDFALHQNPDVTLHWSGDWFWWVILLSAGSCCKPDFLQRNSLIGFMKVLHGGPQFRTRESRK